MINLLQFKKKPNFIYNKLFTAIVSLAILYYTQNKQSNPF